MPPDSPALEEKAPAGTAARVKILLVFAALLYFFTNIQRVAIPGAVFNQLQEKYQLSAPYITALGAIFMYVYAGMQLVVGLLADRFGGFRTMLLGGAVFSVGSLWFPYTETPLPMYVARALTGLGGSMIYLSLIQETIAAFPKNYTIMVAAMIMAGYAGGITANAPFSALVNSCGLDPTLLGVGVLTLLCFLLYSGVLTTVKLPAVRASSFHPEKFLEVLKVRHNRHLFLFIGLNWGIYYVIQTVIGKKYLEDCCGISQGTAAWVLSAMGFLSAVAGFSFAVISRHIGNRRRVFCRISGVMCATALLGITVLTAAAGGWLPAVLFCCLATTASMTSIAIPLLKETNDPALAGSAIAFMNFCSYVSVAVLGNAAGFLLNIFPPERVGNVLVYSRWSYLALLVPMCAGALVVLRYSWRMREPCEENNN